MPPAFEDVVISKYTGTASTEETVMFSVSFSVSKIFNTFPPEPSKVFSVPLIIIFKSSLGFIKPVDSILSFSPYAI